MEFNRLQQLENVQLIITDDNALGTWPLFLQRYKKLRMLIHKK